MSVTVTQHTFLQPLSFVAKFAFWNNWSFGCNHIFICNFGCSATKVCLHHIPPEHEWILASNGERLTVDLWAQVLISEWSKAFPSLISEGQKGWHEWSQETPTPNSMFQGCMYKMHFFNELKKQEGIIHWKVWGCSSFLLTWFLCDFNMM